MSFYQTTVQQNKRAKSSEVGTFRATKLTSSLSRSLSKPKVFKAEKPEQIVIVDAKLIAEKKIEVTEKTKLFEA